MLGYESRYSDDYSLGGYYDYGFFVFFTVPICTGHAVDFKIPSDVFLVLFSFEFTFACGSFIPVTMIDGEMVQGSASP
jgi:hypothetical protein